LPEKAIKDLALEEMSGSVFDLAFLSQASIAFVGSNVSEAVAPLTNQKEREASMKRPAGKDFQSEGTWFCLGKKRKLWLLEMQQGKVQKLHPSQSRCRLQNVLFGERAGRCWFLS